MKKPGSATDPLWYKDALIYELHVRAFYDSNNHGIGDFPGLVQKLDYLQDLGVTASGCCRSSFAPERRRLRYFDYQNVHPIYGNLDDLRPFAAAHELQVMIELVRITLRPAPWFQRARRRRKDRRNGLLRLSDTDQRYNDVRSFSPTPKSRTGRGIQWLRRTSGTASFASAD